jgi:hypothetical protein
MFSGAILAGANSDHGHLSSRTSAFFAVGKEEVGAA